MSTLLQQLYNGEIYPAEQYLPYLEEYKAMRRKHIENCDDFLKKIGSPLDKEFLKIMEEELDTLPLDFFQMFSDGFKLGAKLMIEVLGGEGEKEVDESLFRSILEREA